MSQYTKFIAGGGGIAVITALAILVGSDVRSSDASLLAQATGTGSSFSSQSTFYSSISIPSSPFSSAISTQSFSSISFSQFFSSLVASSFSFSSSSSSSSSSSATSSGSSFSFSRFSFSSAAVQQFSSAATSRRSVASVRSSGVRGGIGGFIGGGGGAGITESAGEVIELKESAKPASAKDCIDPKNPTKRTCIPLIAPLGEENTIAVKPGAQTFIDYFNAAVDLLLTAAVGFAVLWILIGSYLVMISGSDSGKRSQGKEMIVWAMIGLILVNFAGFFLRTLNNIFFV